MTHKSADTGAIERIALFAGTFNPFTAGHDSIVRRALPLFDRIVIGVGHNASKNDDDVKNRVETISRIYASTPTISVMSYCCLTTDFAKSIGAVCLLRGVRSIKDFEYERDMADINRRLSGIETMMLFTLPEYAALSSSVVRELESYGKDVTPFLPQQSNLQS